MRIVARLLTAFLLAIIIAPAVVGAASARSGGDVIVPLSQTTNDDLYLAGNNVRVEGTVNGDVVAAGRSVVISGRVVGDVWAAAEKVEIRGTVTGTVRVVGQTVVVSGNVGEDALAAGQDVRFEGTIGRDAWLAGDTTRVAGTVGRDVKSAATDVTLAAKIGGSVDAKVGDQLTVATGTTVAGNLVYEGPTQVTPEAGAVIAGRTDFTERVQQEDDHQNFADRLQGNLYWLAASLILLIGILLYARKAAVLAADQIRTRPGISLLAGLGFIVLTPLAVGFLLLSLVGIPLAFFTVAGYLLVIYTAKLFPALLIGGLILQRKSDGFWAALAAGALGLVIYYLLNAVPVLGGLLAIATVCFGAGAQLLLALKLYADNKKKYGV